MFCAEVDIEIVSYTSEKKSVSVYSCVIAEGDSQQYSKHVVNLEKNEF